MKRFFAIGLACLSFCMPVLAAPPLEAYGKLPAVEFLSLSPSGKRYAFVAQVGDVRQLGVVQDTGAVIYGAIVGDMKIRGLEWADDDHVLLASSATFNQPLFFRDAYELQGMTTIDLVHRTSWRVFDGYKRAANVIFGTSGIRQIDGTAYGYFEGLEYKQVSRDGTYAFGGDFRNLYRVNLNTNEVQLFDRGGDGNNRFDWAVDSQGRVIARSEYDARNGIWRLYALAEDNRLIYEKDSPLNRIGLIGLGRSPGTVAIVDEDGGAAVVEEIALADGARVRLLDGIEASRYWHDPVTGLFIGVTFTEGSSQFFDDRLQARFNGTLKAFPNLHVELMSFTPGLDRLLVKTDGDGDSGTFWLVDIASGKAKIIGSSYPAIGAADVGATRWIRYTAGDGLPIEAVLTLPPGRKPEKLPLIMLPHGGPLGVNDILGFNWWAQAFASSGYAVLQPNYRGSAGYGADFLNAGFLQWGRKMQTDLSDGIAPLVQQGIVDPERVCIVGASYGGYAALAGVTLQQGIYRCAVSVAGIADISKFFLQVVKKPGRETERTRFWRAAIGVDNPAQPDVDAISPALSADKAQSPILLIHGKDDTVVPVEQSRHMAKALRKANKSVEFLELEGEDHWLSLSETRLAMLKASVDFVRKHNPPD